MNYPVFPSPFPLTLFVVALVLQITGALGDIPEAIKNEYSSIINEIQTTLNSPEFRLLAEANLMFDKINIVPTKQKQPVDVSEIIIDPQLRLLEAQGEGSYATLYDNYVTKPCKQIIRLEEKLNDLLDQNPQISTDVFDGSVFILGDLPVLYEDIVEICEREYVRKRAQGQQEYDAILEEIDQLIEDTDQGVLTEAVRWLDLQPDQLTYDDQTVNPSKDIAELLLHAGKIRKLEDADELKNFNSIFDSSIEEPCERTIAIATKLNDCLERYPQIDDIEHRYSLMPDYFYVVLRICTRIKRDGNEAIFEEFKKLKLQ